MESYNIWTVVLRFFALEREKFNDEMRHSDVKINCRAYL